MAIFEFLIKIFVEILFEGIILRFWKFIGNSLNKLDEFLFKKKKNDS